MHFYFNSNSFYTFNFTHYPIKLMQCFAVNWFRFYDILTVAYRIKKTYLSIECYKLGSNLPDNVATINYRIQSVARSEASEYRIITLYFIHT